MIIVLTYRSPGGSLTLDVPRLRGLTPEQVATGAYVATHTPPADRYAVPAAGDIAAAYFAAPPGRQTLAPLAVGDLVHAGGAVLELAHEVAGETNVWGSHDPVWKVREAHGGAGSVMHVTSTVVPPDEIAYAEDSRDRLWTGRGGGIWRCLTDPAGRTVPVSWRQAWMDHGPLRPLLPVTVSTVCLQCGQWGGGNCVTCTRADPGAYDPPVSMLPSGATPDAFTGLGIRGPVYRQVVDGPVNP